MDGGPGWKPTSMSLLRGQQHGTMASGHADSLNEGWCHACQSNMVRGSVSPSPASLSEIKNLVPPGPPEPESAVLRPLGDTP